jgi:hypothetical protein
MKLSATAHAQSIDSHYVVTLAKTSGSHQALSLKASLWKYIIAI